MGEGRKSANGIRGRERKRNSTINVHGRGLAMNKGVFSVSGIVARVRTGHIADRTKGKRHFEGGLERNRKECALVAFLSREVLN